MEYEIIWSNLKINIYDISGIFIVPMSGTWRLSFSLGTMSDSYQDSTLCLFINDVHIEEAIHYSYSNGGLVGATGGREWTLKASAGDSISLRPGTLEGKFSRIEFCIQFRSLYSCPRNQAK